MSHTITIKDRHNGAAIFEFEATERQLASGIAMRAALEAATKARANLAGANLAGASLAGANLDMASLIGERPIFQVGPIGSRCAYFVAYVTDQGIRLRAGCFFGTLAEFEEKLEAEHSDNVHAREYRAALQLIQLHAEIWAPAAADAGGQEAPQ